MEKEQKKKGEERKMKTKTARAALAGKGMCCSNRLIIECCADHCLSIRALRR